MARFRLIRVLCLPESHVSNPLNEFLMDITIALFIRKIWMLISHESLLRYQ